MSWDPRQYLKYSDHRLRPAVDLINRIPDRNFRRIDDLGCGPGTVTRLLAERWPDARVTGVDASPEMLNRATAESPDIGWRREDIAAWTPPEPPDLIFSNAALHWLDGHAALFPRLLSLLAPGGVLAVQMPKNHGAPSHVLMAETVEEGSWKELLAPYLRPAPVADRDLYYDLLAETATRLDIWETTYAQTLEGDDPVFQWIKGTALKPLLDAFDAAGREDWKRDFCDAYREKLRRAYAGRADGRTLFPFRRLFLVATA